MNGAAKVLAVDDDPINISVMEEIFAEQYVLATASSGEQALELAGQIKPDVVLLDIMMPDIDGYEVCRRLRASPDIRQTKIILVSAKALVTERLLGYEAGADDYITKPFDEDEIKSKVKVFLRLKSIEEVDRFKTGILELLSHEVHTPLNAILPVSEMLLADPGMEVNERQSLLQIIQENAGALNHLFQRTMLLCNLRAGRIAMQQEMLDLGTVITRSIEHVRSLPAAKEVSIQLEVPGGCQVQGDSSHLNLVFDALLENAVRFSAPSGSVKVCAARRGPALEISVTDSGKGIDPLVFPILFDGLSVGDVRHHTRGAGLSLAICREIIRAHGGHLSATSIPGQGATFTVTMEPPREAQPGARQAAAGGEASCSPDGCSPKGFVASSGMRLRQ